jgi:hypothetical protein
MDDLIVGAAVYFDPEAADAVPVGWLDEALRLLALNRVPVSEFETVGASTLDETEIQSYPPNAERLCAALASDPVKIVILRCRESETALAIRRQAVAEINGRFGFAFLGLPVEAGLDLKEALLATHRLARLVAQPAYGIAYLRRGRFAPGGYAEGINAGSTLEFPAPEDLQTRDRIVKWFIEMGHERRYLRGGFRSVYPVQLLSEAHRQARLDTGVTVAELPLGQWTPTEDGMWLWELTDAELTEAKALFERSGLLLAA